MSRSLDQREKEHVDLGPTRTLAEQKMDRNIKKLNKSGKTSKWNPSDWNIGVKLRKKINTRKWDDVNVGPEWGPVTHTPRESRTLVGHKSSPPRRSLSEEQPLPRPTLLPEKGSVFLKKSKAVFFSSMGRMHESCGTLTASRPPVSPEPAPPSLSHSLSSASSSPSSSPSSSSSSLSSSKAPVHVPVLIEVEDSCQSSEDSDHIVLVSSDSVSISSTGNVGESSQEEDNEAHIPVSDIADVFSSQTENPEPATEILIEQEDWEDEHCGSDQDELKRSIRLKVRTD